MNELLTRRRFLMNISRGACGLAGTSLINGLLNAKKHENSLAIKNWIWRGGFDGKTDDELKRILSDFRSAGIDGLLLGGGYEQVVPIAREEGIEVHAWMWTLNNGGMQKEHPEWYTVSRNGVSVVDKPPYVDYYKWLCPSRPEVHEYLKQRVANLAQMDGLAGVHLDYIRYCDVILPIALQPKYKLVQDKEYPEFDFCYCSACRQTFKNQEGVDPLELPDPPASTAWRKYRWDSVTKIVNTLADVVHDHKKIISAAVFPTPELARRLVRQDWPRWNLDAVFPMIYHSFYNEPLDWIEMATREGVTSLPSHRPLYSGVYSLKPDQIGRAVELALAGGAKGVSIFGGFGKEHQQALRNAVNNSSQHRKVP